jgi:pyruvate kinase
MNIISLNIYKMESITKIVATIGPASEKKEIINEMIKHRLDIVRLNFSWGDHEWFSEIIKNVRHESKKEEKNIEIMQDLSGPRVQEGSDHHFGGDEEIITEKDIKDLDFGIKEGVDYIAMSFVGKGSDVKKLRELISEKGGNQKIISKIERKIAVENIDEILEETDGIMVARGDLGNEYPLEEIPFIQHYLIEKANEVGKMVIVATQMMLSMVENEKPTRAEVSDVAYAIIDGADGVMLSEESAKGKNPVQAIEYLEKIALSAEKHLFIDDIIIT